MGDSISDAGGRAPSRWRYRVGLRFLLAAVFFAALVLACVSREDRQARRRTAIVAELSSVGVMPLLEEPTGFSLLVKKLAPEQEPALVERLGRGWFERPTVFLCRQLEDDQVPFAVERLKLLGTVRAVHTEGPRPTQQGVSLLRDGLPGVDVVPSANPALHRYFRNQVEHAHLAVEGLQLAAILAAGLLATVVFLVWPLRRRKAPV